ncbi:MAG TPA: MerR family transcriptional regulator [Umezawaea sp.]|nr:MerR family transcriptional regulator [Umezawaea sp.]
MSELVTTAVAAKELGVATRTIQRWVTEGMVTPDLYTPGGHMRWDVERLKSELRAKRLRDE